jgi:hypothetical protein
MSHCYQTEGGSAPHTQPAEVTITHPDHPYCGQQAVVLRVKGGVHVDLLVRFEDGHQMSVDAEWTDFRSRTGGCPPTVTYLFDVGRARRFVEMVGRLRRVGGEKEVSEP